MLFLGIMPLPPVALACGVDWSLPSNHFEDVDEHGYVSYWEKIGQADLGDGLVIPININFNSHREAVSPTLGKGWMVALLESHVEPIDEISMKVIMPDGWNFYFFRNSNTDTWRGNAGWVGETDGARFTIVAPCGWKIKYDSGKIQEIDTPKDRTISIKYNGSAAVEADIDGKPFMQVEDEYSDGVANDFIIAGQKVSVTQSQRPCVQSILGKSLIARFDSTVSHLHWPDGQQESFDFAVSKDLTPTLVVTKPDQSVRKFSWDADTSRIKTDGDWKYVIGRESEHNVTLERSNTALKSECWALNQQSGMETVKSLDGHTLVTYRFPVGPLHGFVRKIVKDNITIYSAAYDEQRRLIRETRGALIKTISYQPDGSFTYTEVLGGKQIISLLMNSKGDAIGSIEMGSLNITRGDRGHWDLSSGNKMNAIPLYYYDEQLGGLRVADLPKIKEQ